MSVDDVRRGLDYLVDLKRASCAADGGPSDLSPFVIGGFADGTVLAAELLGPREGFVEAVAQIRSAHPDALLWIAQCADVLVQDKRDTRKHASGMTPSEARDAGDMAVVDALNVYLVRVDGGDYNGRVVYHYDDRGEPEFDPFAIEPAPGRGFVPKALRAALAASAE